MMKREIVYCDKCRTQMTVIDADGDATICGYELKGRGTGGLFLYHIEKTSTGSSGSPAAEFHGQHFCSDKCLAEAVEYMLRFSNVKVTVDE